MKKMIFIIMSVILTIGVLSAPVCTIDEDGNYSCSYELPEPESVESCVDGTYEISIENEKTSTMIKIDADMGYIIFDKNIRKITEPDISKLLDALYNADEKKDGSVRVLIKSSGKDELVFNIDEKERIDIMKLIRSIFGEGVEQ